MLWDAEQLDGVNFGRGAVGTPPGHAVVRVDGGCVYTATQRADVEPLARQYGLPAQLREFISAHHGTTVVKYFYLTAKEKALAEGQAAPDDNQFRYPGPKPQSKEAAILMLADGAEGSVRAMTEPTPTRIRAQVHHIVTDRLEDGQLDDCEMTLREVHQIENSIVKSLCSMYHGRIAYPKDDKAEKANGNGNGKKVNGNDPQTL